jgi:hypothetical protein
VLSFVKLPSSRIAAMAMHVIPIQSIVLPMIKF